MDRAEAQRIHRSLVAELQEARGRVDALAQLVEGYEKLFPGLRDPEGGDAGQAPSVGEDEQPAPEYPRGRDAVRVVLREAGGEWMSVEDVTRDLLRRGWPPESNDPNAAVRASLSRVVDEVNVEKGQADGLLAYRWVDQPLTQMEMGASDV